MTQSLHYLLEFSTYTNLHHKHDSLAPRRDAPKPSFSPHALCIHGLSQGALYFNQKKFVQPHPHTHSAMFNSYIG